MPSKKRRQFSTYFDNILPTITKNNNIFELQGFLKHNDFAEKIVKKLKFSMLKDLTKINQYEIEKTIVLKTNYSRLNNHLVFAGVFKFELSSLT